MEINSLFCVGYGKSPHAKWMNIFHTLKTLKVSKKDEGSYLSYISFVAMKLPRQIGLAKSLPGDKGFTQELAGTRLGR